jgi:hypothetical protein
VKTALHFAKANLSAGSIPKGLRPKAQGCSARATLGRLNRNATTPTGLRPIQPYWLAQRRNPFRVVSFAAVEPRVAHSSQPWALGRNAVGILGCDQFGHVTPFLLLGENVKPTLYFGAARGGAWGVNYMVMVTLSATRMNKLK